MGLGHRTIFAVTLAILGVTTLFLPATLSAQPANTGTVVILRDYVLPQYNKENRLQFIIYGDQAINKGSSVLLSTPMIDIVNNDVKNLSQVQMYKPGQDPEPTPYELAAPQKVVNAFWDNPKRRHSRALIFSKDADFDKSVGILRSDDKATFRSREMDVDGIGFDAYPERKFIHIRSQVRVVIRADFRRSVSDEESNVDSVPSSPSEKSASAVSLPSGKSVSGGAPASPVIAAPAAPVTNPNPQPEGITK